MADVDQENRFKQNNYYGSLVPDEYTPVKGQSGDEPSHNTLDVHRNRNTTVTSSFSEVQPLVQAENKEN